MSYLANFAKTGNPNREKLPPWPAWDNTRGKEKILVLDAGVSDLRLSYLCQTISVRSILDLINTELEEPERGNILAMLDDFIPLD